MRINTVFRVSEKIPTVSESWSIVYVNRIYTQMTFVNRPFRTLLPYSLEAVQIYFLNTVEMNSAL